MNGCWNFFGHKTTRYISATFTSTEVNNYISINHTETRYIILINGWELNPWYAIFVSSADWRWIILVNHFWTSQSVHVKSNIHLCGIYKSLLMVSKKANSFFFLSQKVSVSGFHNLSWEAFVNLLSQSGQLHIHTFGSFTTGKFSLKELLGKTKIWG